MRTGEFLFGPEAWLFRPALAAGVAIAILGGLLSPLVVLKRLAFIGQGVSHAAFGGVGVAAILGLAGVGGAGSAGSLIVIAAFCIATSLGIAWMSGRGASARDGRIDPAGGEDTFIGIFLVGSMALGAVLLHWRARRVGMAPSWESWLFGSLADVSMTDAWAAWIALAAIAVAAWWTRRMVIFWAFDEMGARAFGARTGMARTVLLVMLAVTIVVSMKLAGVILATALTVLPGAAALKLSHRLGVVVAWSVAIAVVGVGGGMVLSFESDVPPGPAVVAVLIVAYAAAHPLGAVLRRSMQAAGAA